MAQPEIPRPPGRRSGKGRSGRPPPSFLAGCRSIPRVIPIEQHFVRPGSLAQQRRPSTSERQARSRPADHVAEQMANAHIAHERDARLEMGVGHEDFLLDGAEGFDGFEQLADGARIDAGRSISSRTRSNAPQFGFGQAVFAAQRHHSPRVADRESSPSACATNAPVSADGLFFIAAPSQAKAPDDDAAFQHQSHVIPEQYVRGTK